MVADKNEKPHPGSSISLERGHRLPRFDQDVEIESDRCALVNPITLSYKEIKRISKQFQLSVAIKNQGEKKIWDVYESEAIARGEARGGCQSPEARGFVVLFYTKRSPGLPSGFRWRTRTRRCRRPFRFRIHPTGLCKAARGARLKN